MPGEANTWWARHLQVCIYWGPKLLKGQRPILVSAEKKPTMVVVAVQGAPSSSLPWSLPPSILPHSSSCSHTRSWHPCSQHLSHKDSHPIIFSAGHTGCNHIHLRTNILAFHQV